MGLFKKKDAPTQTQVIKCPVCGCEHTVNVHHYTGFYMDGMHNLPVSKAMEMMVVCTTCGLLYSAEDLAINWKEKLQSKEYQQALAKQYPSLTEQKLALWDALLHGKYMPMYYAHYYHEIGNTLNEQKALRTAIDAINTRVDTDKYHVNGKDIVNFRDAGLILMTPDVRLVDLYRRTQQWDAALTQIEKLRSMEYMVTPYTLLSYLKDEEKLIHQKNSKLL